MNDNTSLVSNDGLFYLVLAGLSIGFGLLTVRKKSLTPSGALSAVFTGITVVLLSGISALIPLLIFFGGTQLLSRLFIRKKSKSDSKSGKPRDAIQVFSNGGVYLICSVLHSFTGDPIFQSAMLVSIAIAMADTWSSEIGCSVQGKTYSFPDFKETAAGVSGGISLEGTLGGITGAMIIAIYSLFAEAELKMFFTIFAAGVGGMFLDSLIGHYLQLKFFDTSTHKWCDYSDNFQATKGFYIVTNDAVNISSNLLMTLFFLFVA